MSAFVLLDLLKELRKSDKMQGLPNTLSHFAIYLINSMKQDYTCKILFIT